MAEIVNNVLEKGVNSQNREVAISIGTEDLLNPTHRLLIRGNRFSSDLPGKVRFVHNFTRTPARLEGNTPGWERDSVGGARDGGV